MKKRKSRKNPGAKNTKTTKNTQKKNPKRSPESKEAVGRKKMAVGGVPGRGKDCDKSPEKDHVKESIEACGKKNQKKKKKITEGKNTPHRGRLKKKPHTRGAQGKR